MMCCQAMGNIDHDSNIDFTRCDTYDAANNVTCKDEFTRQMCFESFAPDVIQLKCPVTCGVQDCSGECSALSTQQVDYVVLARVNWQSMPRI